MAAPPRSRRLIVDSQVHLWQAETPDWRWVPNVTPQLPEPFTIERLLPMMDDAGVERVVVVPPSWVGDRNDYALEAAKRYPGRFAVMGRFPVRDPKSASLLPTWKQQPGMLGVRLTFLGPTAAWLSDGSLDWFWPAAEKAGIPVMFLTGAGVLSRFVPIAERHPGLTLIIDHMNLSTEAVQKKTVSAEIDQVVALAAELRPIAERLALANPDDQPAFFELMTAMAFLQFARSRCDIGVLEVGLGGRLDATNVVTPEVAVITSIAPSSSVMTSSAPASRATSITLSSDVPGANTNWPQCLN